MEIVEPRDGVTVRIALNVIVPRHGENTNENICQIADIDALLLEDRNASCDPLRFRMEACVESVIKQVYEKFPQYTGECKRKPDVTPANLPRLTNGARKALLIEAMHILEESDIPIGPETTFGFSAEECWRYQIEGHPTVDPHAVMGRLVVWEGEDKNAMRLVESRGTITDDGVWAID